MLRFVGTTIIDRFIPEVDETSLVITVTDKFLEKKNFPIFNAKRFEQIVKNNLEKHPEIDGVVFVGGEKDPNDMFVLAYDFKMKHPNLTIGWFTEYNKIVEIYMSDLFDYIRIAGTDNNSKVYGFEAGSLRVITKEGNQEMDDV